MMELLYTKPVEYISDELKRIDLIIKTSLMRQRSIKTNDNNVCAGLFVSDQEADELVENKINTSIDSFDFQNIKKALDKQENLIKRKLARTRSKGILVAMERLKNIFGLTPMEVDILLLCLAPQLDAKYEKLYSYIQDDITKKYPSLHLFFNLFTRTFEERVQLRNCFLDQSPLIRWHFLEFPQDRHEPHTSALSGPICIDKSIVSYLLGNLLIDAECKDSFRITKPLQDFGELNLQDSLKLKLKNLIIHFQDMSEFKKNVVAYFHGMEGSGKTKAAEAVCNALNIPILEVNLKHLLQQESSIFKTFDRIIRGALLLQGCLLVRNFDLLLSADKKISRIREYILKEISAYSRLTFLTGEKDCEFNIEQERARLIKLHFPIPDFSLRKQIWEKHLNGRKIFVKEISLDDLSAKFKFTEGQIKSAINAAGDRSLYHSVKKGKINKEDLLVGCKSQCNNKLSELAVLINAKSSWEDIALPIDQLAQLKEISAQFRFHSTVYETWEFRKKIPYGNGLNILFSGPSGTGKTMAAGIISNELQLELFKIDLSTVVSKYIGETEKNLSRIFKEAETSNAILFFDEADALFGKRSEVKDAHDRYANIETGYLLQKMEEYEGIVILATNLKQNMDDAFVRRMQFIVEFPFPDEKQREQIWKGMFPKAAPLSKNIDYEFLSKSLTITGGNIKNIALCAAFYAAEKSSRISMKHLMLASKREYLKMGKTFLKTDFEPYYKMANSS